MTSKTWKTDNNLKVDKSNPYNSFLIAKENLSIEYEQLGMEELSGMEFLGMDKNNYWISVPTPGAALKFQPLEAAIETALEVNADWILLQILNYTEGYSALVKVWEKGQFVGDFKDE